MVGWGQFAGGNRRRQWTRRESARAGPSRTTLERIYGTLNGALSLETIEARPVFEGDAIRDLQVEEKNRAKELIEDFMIAANGVTARYLSARKFPSIRRVVRTPKRWDRIVADCRGTQIYLAGESRFQSAGGISDEAKSRRPASIPRSVARRDQTSGRG